MRIINSFSQKLNGTLSVRVQNPGTEFIVTIPRQSSTLTPDKINAKARAGAPRTSAQGHSATSMLRSRMSLSGQSQTLDD